MECSNSSRYVVIGVLCRHDVAHSPTQWTFSAFSSEKDYEETKTFFEVGLSFKRSPSPFIHPRSQDKDTSKYIMNLKQALDGIRSRAAWIDVRLDPPPSSSRHRY